MKTIYDTAIADQDVFTLEQLMEAGREIGATHLILTTDSERDDGDIYEEHEVLFLTEDDDVDQCTAELEDDCPVIRVYGIQA